MTPPAQTVWWAILGVFPLSLALTALMIALAHKQNWVVRPKADRWHQQPTALYGGVAIVLSYMVGVGALLLLSRPYARPELLGLLAGGLTLFAVGLRDDIRALNPLVKLLGQFLSIMPFLVGILVAHPTPLVIFTVPLLAFWVLALMNATNLLDNMDGLSGGTASVIASLLAGYALQNRQFDIAALSLLMLTSCLGFLWFNFRITGRARIFMGDCSSMFLGYMLAGLCYLSMSQNADSVFTGLLLPLLLMAVPIFDTTLVIIRRKREGRAISQGGKDHSSHRLVYAGLNEKQAVLLLCGISLLTGGTGIVLASLKLPALLVPAVLAAAVCLFSFGRYLSRFAGPQKAAIAVPREHVPLALHPAEPDTKRTAVRSHSA